MASSTAALIQNLIGRTIPWGRIPSTTSSRPKATAGAHEAPNIMSTIDSTMPRISPAASVPVMLPRPASTTTQKVRPM